MIEIEHLLFSCTWLIVYISLQFCTWLILRAWVSSTLALPASFAVSLLWSTLISWYLAWLGFSPTYTLGVFLVLAGIVFGTIEKARIGILSDLNEGKWYYALFLLVFCVMLIVRMFHPDINIWMWDKFMNHGFIASMMRTPVVPPLDPWFAGGTLEVYYYLGHWCFATLGTITQIPSWIVFQFVAPTVASVSAVQLYGIGKLLLKKFPLLPVILLFIPNTGFISHYITGLYHGLLLQASVRVIPATFTEYPLYTFLFGDAHAHAMGIFNQTFFLLMIVYIFTQWQKIANSERAVCAILTGISLGTMVGMTVWSAFAYAPLALLAALVIWHNTHNWTEKAEGTWLSKVFIHLHTDISGLLKKGTEMSHSSAAILYIWVLVPLIAFLSYAPFFIIMSPAGAQGIGIVRTKTMLPEFFLAFGWFLFLLLCTLYSDIKKQPKLLLIAIPFIIVGYPLIGLVFVLLAYLIARHEGVSDLLFISGLLLVLLCDLIYVIDSTSWSDWYRLNTLWKLYCAAWFLFGVGALCSAATRVEQLMGRVCHREEGVFAKKYSTISAIGGVLVLFLVCELVYIIATNSWGRWHRLNTLWAFYCIAWLLLGIGALCSTSIRVDQFMNRVFHERNGAIIEKCITRLVTGGIFLLILWTPIINHELGSVTYSEIQGLDGYAWMEKAHPDDYAAIMFLNELPGEHVLIAAAGDVNLYHTRISSGTGIPMILGGPSHESSWRGDNPPGWWAERTMDISIIYEQPERALEIMEKYNADLLILGTPERERYQVPDAKGAYLPDLVPIFTSGEMTIYQWMEE